nr:MAG TPA: hypothetical protein [Caudoviricetes sp.]
MPTASEKTGPCHGLSARPWISTLVMLRNGRFWWVSLLTKTEILRLKKNK